MTNRPAFGQWLKERRRTLDLTREDLARKIGCAAVTLYKIEVGERRPSKQIALLLAEHLHIPPQDHAAFVVFARDGAHHDASASLWGTPFHPPTNLPASLTPIIGRDENVNRLRKLLLQPETRLLTLVGPPGIGKTRLAMQTASTVRDNFSDGSIWVPLAPISDAGLVLTTIAAALGLDEGGSQVPLQRLKTFLRDQHVLLVLDNFEQILPAASQIAELLATCAQLKVLATSRTPLRIRPERQFPVPTLELPQLAHLPSVEELTHYSAISLFIERAQAVQPDFTLTSSNAPEVAAICTRLDGLPLAIELISARVKVLPPAMLLDRLHGRLMLQSDGLRDVEPRHRTLNAAIDWSYLLLNANEQALFRRLGVFVGGWTTEAAEVVCMERLNLNVIDGLAALLDSNLIKRETQPDGGARFTMLETIREYALEQLTVSGELDTLQQRHSSYFLHFSEAPDLELASNRQQSRKMNRLEVEITNFRAALLWYQKTEATETLLRLAVTLSDLWMRSGHLREAGTWLATALTLAESESPTTLSAEAYTRLRAAALSQLGVILQWQGDLDAALPYNAESVALYRELGDLDGLIQAIGNYGMLFVLRSDSEQARPLLEERLRLSFTLHQEIGIGLFFMGTLAYLEGNTDQADQYWAESINSLGAKDNIWTLWTLALALSHQAMVALDQRAYDKAQARLVESITLLREMEESWQVIHTLEVSACLAAFQGRESTDAHETLLRAAHIFGAAERQREIMGAPVLSYQRPSYERGLAALRDQLDEPALQKAWLEGRKLTLEQAVEQALKA